jgi:hypothetical protein
MVNVFALSAVGLWFKPRSGQTNDYKIDICCIKEKEQRRARNQENVPEWVDISIRGLLFQLASTIQIQISVLV